MRVKMIFFVIFISLYSLFAALNMTNVSKIRFGFATIENVPVFLTITISFALGTLFMLPFVFTKKKDKVPPADDKKALKEAKKEAKKNKDIYNNNVETTDEFKI